MPPQNVCEYHIKLAEDIAVIKNDTTYLREAKAHDREELRKHIDEGEKEGGIRDRLRVLEGNKKWDNLRLVIAGVLSGLFVRVAPDTLGTVFAYLWKVLCKI